MTAKTFTTCVLIIVPKLTIKFNSKEMGQKEQRLAALMNKQGTATGFSVVCSCLIKRWELSPVAELGQ